MHFTNGVVLAQVRKSSFARTGQAMRAMEAVAVATAQQEPVLLVGETGTGKTTLVQQIAEQVCCLMPGLWHHLSRAVPMHITQAMAMMIILF